MVGTLPRAGRDGQNARMDDAVRAYADDIAPDHRPLFDRLHALILDVVPDATVEIKYGMPAYGTGRRRVYLGVWKHGLSIYGWAAGQDGGFVERHPDLLSGKGTIKLRPADAAVIDDEEFRALVRAALGVG